VSQPNTPMNQGPDRIDYRETADITEVHASVEREKPEPSADTTPMPLWLAGICAGAMVWAGTYFGVFHGGLSASVYNEYESSPAVLFPLPQKAGGGAAAAEAPLSLAQQGKAVYSQCVTCHQGNGAGVPGQFPPLAKSEWVTGSEKRLVAILLKGLQGPITIGGEKHTYGGNMVGWEGSLSDKKIAGVVSYIRSQWGNAAPEISEAKVKAARAEFAAQKAQWTEAELLQIPADATLPDAAGAAAPAAGGAPATAAAAPATGGADLMAEGKKNYMAICVACHQPTGMGLPGVFPPLAKTEYVNGDPKRFAAMILKGVGGPITVDGKLYNSMMPGQEAVLTDSKIASILTYVRASFGNSSPPVMPEIVAAARKEHAARTTPWTETELKAMAGAAP
jgi:mono/diheme cytochrome c family protein